MTSQSTSPPTAQCTAVDSAIAAIEAEQQRIEECLDPASGITATTVIASMRLLLTRQPDLALCSRASLVGAALQAARIGLLPDPRRGHLWVTATTARMPDGAQRTDATVIVGYLGLAELARRAGVQGLQTGDHYEHDHLVYSAGTDPRLDHRPATGERGRLLGCWAASTSPRSVAYLTADDIDHRVATYSSDDEGAPTGLARDDPRAYRRRAALWELLRLHPSSAAVPRADASGGGTAFYLRPEDGTLVSIEHGVVVTEPAQALPGERQ